MSVVDATATVLAALQDWQSLAEFRDFGLAGRLEEGLDWLETATLPEGGWGLIAGGPYLNYSSALAVHALCICGRRASQSVHKALRRFMSEVDPATGGWNNANRHVSVPVTAEVIRALNSAADRQVRYSAEISKACTWLLAVARPTEFWAATQATGNVEEIEVVIGGKRVRIEYGYSPRPAAVQALAVADDTISPEIVVAVRKLIDDLIADRWESIGGAHHSVPTSWMLYDAIVALVSFRNAFSQRTASVWADNVRVVEHSRDHGPLVRTIREHKIKLIGGLACLMLVWMLKAAGLVNGLGLATIFFVLSTVALNVAGNIVFELLRVRKRRRSIPGI